MHKIQHINCVRKRKVITYVCIYLPTQILIFCLLCSNKKSTVTIILKKYLEYQLLYIYIRYGSAVYVVGIDMKSKGFSKFHTINQPCI